MPIYTFNCPDHGAFELLLPIRESERKRAKCACGRFGARMAELTTMRPDKFWSGAVDPNYGYVTSASQLKQEMKRRNHVTIGDRTDREGMDKVAENAQKAKEDKLKRDMRGWAERAFGPSGLGLGGADGAKLMKDAKLT